MRKIKILVITSTFPRWKNDTEPGFVYELTKRLTDAFEVFVLCPYAPASKQYEETENMKISRYKYLPFGLGNLAYDGGIMSKLKKNGLYYFQVPFFLLFQLLAIRKIIKKNKIDIIHAHWLIPNGFIAVIYKSFINKKIKILMTIHGTDFWGLNNFIGKMIKKFTLKHIDTLTVASTALQKAVSQFCCRYQIFVCPMGVDTSLFSPEKKDHILKIKLGIKGYFLLFVGSIVEAKGIRSLIEAMPRVIQKFPDTKLVVVGKGNLKPEMIELSSSLGISNNVLFTGAVAHNDLPAYFATADLFILPSLSEGWPVVVMEALSSATLSIVTDIPVFTNLENKEDFIRVIRKNNVSDISDCIISILNNQQDNSALRQNARVYAITNFDWKKVSNKFKDVINKMITQT